MRKIVAIVLSVFVLCGSMFAEPVTGLKVEGLRKTKESFMHELLDGYLGKDSEEIDLKQVETILQAQGLFSEIDVQIEKSDEAEGTEEAVLAVTVKEKITFIPLPFAMYSSDSGFMGGFMLMNMNAFGKKYMLVTGGVFAADRQTGMLIYSKPAGDLKHPGYSVYGSAAHKKDKVSDFEDNTILDVESFMARARFSVNENLNKYVSLSTGVDYCFQDFFTDDYKNNHQILVSSGVGFNHVNWNGYYLIANNFNLSGEVGYCATEEKLVQDIKASGMLQYAFVPRVRGIWTASGELETGKFLLNKADSGSVGSTIMYKKFKTDQIFGTGLALEEALVKMKFGTVSLFETYEFDMAKNPVDDSFVYCHGPGAGVKLYIKQLAFPAMNIGFSYNVPQNDWKFVASFGMSM